MAAGKTLVVTGPLATPYREDGSRVYLYEGAEVPDGLREGEVERMVDLGLFGEKPPDKPAAKKAAASKSSE